MDVKLIIFILFIGFKVVQAIVKKANEDTAKQHRQVQRGNPDRKRRVQSEIESFLSEVGGGAAAPAKKESAALQQREQQKQQAIAKRRQQEERRRRREAAAAHEKTEQKKNRRVGSGISEHVDQYINQHVSEHIDDDVSEYVEASVIDNVEDHLGDRDLEMPAAAKSTSRKSSDAARTVAAMLRNPEGVRNAILVNEVLSRPRSLR